MKLDRLKSLPLTIGLTLLIWLYAESQVRPTQNASEMEIEVPVWVAGPPDIINDNDVIVDPRVVKVTIAGTQEALNKLDKRMVGAYLDVDWGDRDVTTMTRKALRVTAPSGLTVARPVEVNFKLSEKAPAQHRAGS